MQRSFEFDFFRSTPVGEIATLPAAGTPLELPEVYASAAEELKRLAERGLLEVVAETRVDDQVTQLRFRRLK